MDRRCRKNWFITWIIKLFRWKFKIYCRSLNSKSLCFLDLKITSDHKKLLTSVYSEPTNSDLYLDGTLCHSTKSIDEISTGVAKLLKWICSHDSNFLEQ